ncbi:peptidoglycan-binding domain-containing protein [Paracoccus gahaiensis]|uniref:peptidoglycan-binding domain-containing protein n=1 Tax=Paracoccus gahaiensis TaxID=1706839 RepID=UPI001B7FE02C|nr:peptidoglycan-binding domain-containing protein [Paracoccus gahaiensis]
MMGKATPMRRRVAAMVLATALPGMALAQEAVIRLEAKRLPGAATEAAAGWAARFDDVVTLPLPGGWTGIALGPLDPAQAEARLRDLRAAGAVPGDSFVSVPAPGTALTPAGGGPEAGLGDATAPVASPPPGSFLQLASFADRAEAEAALARTREEFPGAGLWDLPEGRFAVALGPVAEEAARAWLPVLAEAGLIPEDAMRVDGADLGQPLDEGQAPDLPLPDAAQPLPPLHEVQRALRWAGHYAGEIDGKDGPMTRAAIRAEIAEGRASTDPGTALQHLIAARAEWRDRMGVAPLRDDATGLTVAAPMGALQFDRAERALSIYGPRDGSGAALILFSQPGGQQELLDLAGLVTALGWVPAPDRNVRQGHVTLRGANDAHIGAAEGWVRDGRAEGWVLIWPAADPDTQARLTAELSDSLARHAPGATEAPAPMDPAGPPPETISAPDAASPVLP